jgi:hypothetical protein
MLRGPGGRERTEAEYCNLDTSSSQIAKASLNLQAAVDELLWRKRGFFADRGFDRWDESPGHVNANGTRPTDEGTRPSLNTC